MRKILQNLKDISLISAIFFAFSYFSGYVYLMKYFNYFGAQFIPIRNIPNSEIAIIGLLPLLVFSFLMLPVFKIYNLKCKGSKFLRKLLEKLNKTFFILFTSLLGLLGFILFVGYYAQITRTFNLPYNGISTLSFDKIPIVEIVYNTQLIYTDEENQVENKNVGTLTVTGITLGTAYSEVNDKIARDQRGNPHFFGKFTLYFESEDSYFVAPVTKKQILTTILQTVNPDSGKEEVISSNLGDEYINGVNDTEPYRIIIIPKRFVESIKYSHDPGNF